MLAVLRPLRLGELLDRAVRIYRHNFLHLVGIVALVQVPITLLQIAVSLTAFNDTFARLGDVLNNPAASPDDPFAVFGPAYFAGASLNSVLAIVAFILLQGVATAALTASIAGSYFGDPPESILDAYRRIKDKWLSVVGALLLAVVLAIALGFWWLIPCFGWLTGGGMLVFLWYVIVPLLTPIILLEDGSPTRAWRRAWELARRRFWWVLGFAFVLYIFNLIIVAGPAAIISIGAQFVVGDPLELSNQRFTIQTIAQSLTVLITGLFYLPLQVAAMTLLYFDLRVRTEGVDLAFAAEASAAPDRIFTSIAILPSGSLDEPLLSGVDWRNFMVLTLGVIIAFLLLYGILVLLAVALLSVIGFL